MKISITFKIFLPIAIIVILTMMAFMYKSLLDIETELDDKIKTSVKLLSSVSQEHILTKEFSTLDGISQEMSKDRDIVKIFFYDTSNQVISKYLREGVKTKNILSEQADIKDGNTLIGKVEVGLSLQKKENLIISTGITIVIMVVAIILGILAAMKVVIINPVQKLKDGAHKLFEGDLGYQIKFKKRNKVKTEKLNSYVKLIQDGENINSDEIEQTALALNVMSKGIKDISQDNFTKEDLIKKLENEFDKEDEILQTTIAFNAMSNKLKDLTEKMTAAERLKKEMEMASSIQTSMLPKTLPKIDGYEIYATSKMAQEAGGDLYDVIELGNNRYLIVVGDVSGKGMPAALYMSSAMNMLRTEIACFSLSRREDDKNRIRPGYLLQILNKLLKGVMKSGNFISMYLGILDTNSHTFEISSAGHDPCYVYNPSTKKLTTEVTEGQACGIVPPRLFDNRVQEKTFSIEPNDFIIIHTDGITEAKNPKLELYDANYEPFICTIDQKNTPEQVVNNLFMDISKFVQEASQYDDMTVLCFKRK